MKIRRAVCQKHFFHLCYMQVRWQTPITHYQTVIHSHLLQARSMRCFTYKKLLFCVTLPSIKGNSGFCCILFQLIKGTLKNNWQQNSKFQVSILDNSTVPLDAERETNHTCSESVSTNQTCFPSFSLVVVCQLRKWRRRRKKNNK